MPMFTVNGRNAYCNICHQGMPNAWQNRSAHNCRDLNVPEWLVKARAKRKEGT